MGFFKHKQKPQYSNDGNLDNAILEYIKRKQFTNEVEANLKKDIENLKAELASLKVINEKLKEKIEAILSILKQ